MARSDDYWKQPFSKGDWLDSGLVFSQEEVEDYDLNSEIMRSIVVTYQFHQFLKDYEHHPLGLNDWSRKFAVLVYRSGRNICQRTGHPLPPDEVWEHVPMKIRLEVVGVERDILKEVLKWDHWNYVCNEILKSERFLTRTVSLGSQASFAQGWGKWGQNSTFNKFTYALHHQRCGYIKWQQLMKSWLSARQRGDVEDLEEYEDAENENRLQQLYEQQIRDEHKYRDFE